MKELIVEFFREVKNQLVEKYHKSDIVANFYVEIYKNNLNLLGLTEDQLILHQSVEELSEALSLWKLEEEILQFSKDN